MSSQIKCISVSCFFLIYSLFIYAIESTVSDGLGWVGVHNTECASACIMKGKRCHMRLLIGHGSSSRFIKTFASNPLASACPPARLPYAI